MSKKKEAKRAKTHRPHGHSKTRVKRRKNSPWSAFKRFFLAMSISLVLGLLAFQCFFSFGKMDGYSMMPTVNHGDIVIAKRVQQPKRFDLIYLKIAGKRGRYSIRRVIGVPGDQVMYQNDELFVNNKGKPERYLMKQKLAVGESLLTEDFTLEEVTGSVVVPEGCYFVLGDNRQSSADSRTYGFIEKKNIKGILEMSIFPAVVNY